MLKCITCHERLIIHKDTTMNKNIFETIFHDFEHEHGSIYQ